MNLSTDEATTLHLTSEALCDKQGRGLYVGCQEGFRFGGGTKLQVSPNTMTIKYHLYMCVCCAGFTVEFTVIMFCHVIALTGKRNGVGVQGRLGSFLRREVIK